MTETMLRGYPARWTRPVPPHDGVDVAVVAAAGIGRVTGEQLVTVRTADGLLFSAAESTLLCLHDGEEDASDCLLNAIRREGGET